MTQAAAQINETDVEAFFKSLGDVSGPNATGSRPQRRRLIDSASSLWRSMVSGNAAELGGGAGSKAGTPISQGPSGGSATSFRAAKEQGAVLALTTNVNTGLLLRPRVLANPTVVEIGKTTLSETERWKLQAALRREETKASGEKYNQNMLRETKTAKPPTPGEAFPAGRGKPVR